MKVWSLSSGACKLTLHGHQAAVTCVQFDKTKIISGALDTLIKIWNFSSGEVSEWVHMRRFYFTMMSLIVVHSNYGLDSFRGAHRSDQVVNEWGSVCLFV